jgi:hypothetical protein
MSSNRLQMFEPVKQFVQVETLLTNSNNKKSLKNDFFSVFKASIFDKAENRNTFLSLTPVWDVRQ